MNPLRDSIRSALKATGASLEMSFEELERLAAQQAIELALAVDEPSFDEVVQASVDTLIVRAAITAVGEARDARERVRGILELVLRSAVAGGLA